MTNLQVCYFLLGNNNFILIIKLDPLTGDGIVPVIMQTVNISNNEQ